MAKKEQPDKRKTSRRGQRDVRGGSRSWLGQTIAELQRAFQGGSGPPRGPS